MPKSTLSCPIVLVGCLLLPSGLSAQQADLRELGGHLFEVDEGEQDKVPLADVELSVDGANSDITNKYGYFRIPLPPGYRSGREVTLTHDMTGYAIHHPLFSKQRLPERAGDLIEVRMLPKGSKLFWTHNRIEEFIKRTMGESTKELKPKDAKQTDLSKYVLELGEEYGFSERQVRDQIGQWMQAAKHDPNRSGLAAFAEGNFNLAREKFLESARRNDAEATRNYEWAGHSYYNELRFSDALDVYTKTRARIDRAEQRDWWKSISLRLANSHLNLGERVEPSKGNAHLNEAVGVYRELLKMTDPQTNQDFWAMTQNNLGSALYEQGIRVEGLAGVTLLAEAVAAYRESLKIFTQDKRLAATQNNLANALSQQGTRAAGMAGVTLLAEAVAAYRKSLKFYTQEQHPRDWAMTQNNLGNALRNQGIRAAGLAGLKLLEEAVAAYREALKVRSQEQLPQDWAATQNNLGNALRDQGSRVEGLTGVKLLEEAVAAYREALKVYTREELPQDWAMTQNNLGNTLSDQGFRTPGKAGVTLLEEAVAAYRDALVVFTQDQLPQPWAMTQNNIGAVLREQGIRAEGLASVKLLEEAVAAFRETLKVYTRDELPQNWARTQNNLGAALRELAVRLDGQKKQTLLGESAGCFANALEIYTETAAPAFHHIAFGNLAETSWELAAENKDWKKVEELMPIMFARYPDDRRLYRVAARMYHEERFTFEKAFDLHKQWLAGHPEDLAARNDFAKTHFTTGRFSEGVEYIGELLTKSHHRSGHDDPGSSAEATASTQAALLVLQTANHVSLAQHDAAQSTLAALIKRVANQPARFQIAWSWKGVRHFIEHAEQESVIKHRDWLLQLITAAEGKNRDEIQQRLDKLHPPKQ